jgi:hypothetical protein
MNIIMTVIFLSPLFPLKGRIATYINQTNLAIITPLRGQGVGKLEDKLISIPIL